MNFFSNFINSCNNQWMDIHSDMDTMSISSRNQMDMEPSNQQVLESPIFETLTCYSPEFQVLNNLADPPPLLPLPCLTPIQSTKHQVYITPRPLSPLTLPPARNNIYNTHQYQTYQTQMLPVQKEKENQITSTHEKNPTVTDVNEQIPLTFPQSKNQNVLLKSTVYQTNCFSPCLPSQTENQQYTHSSMQPQSSLSLSQVDIFQTQNGLADSKNSSQQTYITSFQQAVAMDQQLTNETMKLMSSIKPQTQTRRKLIISYPLNTLSVCSQFTVNTEVIFPHKANLDLCSTSNLSLLLHKFRQEMKSVNCSQILNIPAIIEQTTPISLASSSFHGDLSSRIIYDYTNTSWELLLINIIMFVQYLGCPKTLEHKVLYESVYLSLKQKVTSRFTSNMPPRGCFIIPKHDSGYLYIGAIIEPYTPYMTLDMLTHIFNYFYTVNS